MPDRESILDAIAFGLTIDEAADRFGIGKADVREILKTETDRVYNGAEQRSDWMLTARRLQRIELKFARKAVNDMDPVAAVVSIKASERRATLCGANAPIGHTVAIMHQQAAENQGSSTLQMLEAIKRLRNEAEPDSED